MNLNKVTVKIIYKKIFYLTEWDHHQKIFGKKTSKTVRISKAVHESTFKDIKNCVPALCVSFYCIKTYLHNPNRCLRDLLFGQGHRQCVTPFFLLVVHT